MRNQRLFIRRRQRIVVCRQRRGPHAGITDNLIRVAVGLEALDDLLIDLQRGINAL